VIKGSAFWDDWAFIFRNSQLHNASSPLVYFNGTEVRAWPFFHTVLWILYKLFDWNFYYYHILSILVHGLNGFLCFKFLKKLNLENSFLIAIIFLTHPLQLFNIGWIIQIKTLIATTFLFLSLIALIDYFHKKKLSLYVLSVLFFGLSVLTKSTSAIFTLSFLAAYPKLKWNISLKNFIVLIFPYLALSIVAIHITLWHWQQRYLLLISLLFIAFYYLYLNYKIKILDQVYLIIPLVFIADVVYVFRYTNIKIVFFVLSALFIVMVIRFKIVVKKYFYLFQPLILILISLLYFPVEGSWFFSILIQSSKIILSLKTFFRYLLFIFFPTQNVLFPSNTIALQNSFELVGIFICMAILIKLYHYLIYKQLNILLLGVFFFTITLIPFCGIIQIPIFSYSNFAPYWLSIPFIGLLPMISHFIRSRLSLIFIILMLGLLTHYQSYNFLTTEKLFADSLNNHPNNDLIKITLVEQYVFTNQCEKARQNLNQINDQYLLKSLNTLQKVSHCLESRVGK
jgi:hypothetical protein